MKNPVNFYFVNTQKPYPTSEDLPVITVEEIDFSGEYTYADYMRFAFDERLEIIKGKIFKMSPPPSMYHQRTLGKIYNPIYNFLNGKKCEVFCAPFDVRLPKKGKTDKEIYTVLQPDICVVCDPNKLDRRGCIGAPDLVVEILSPGNNRKELVNKYEVYEESGVKEYWIISPSEQTFFKYVLDNDGIFQPTKMLTVGERATSTVLLDFELDLTEVFKD